MGRLLTTSALSALFATASSIAMAGGLDRITYSPSILFEKGNYIEGSVAMVQPSVTGDLDVPGVFDGVSNIAPDYTMWGAGIKLQLTEGVAVAYQTFEALGSDIRYKSNATAVPAVAPPYNFYFPIEVELTGRAHVGTVKVDLNDRFSLYGGVKHIIAEGEATGLLGPTGGSFDFKRGSGTGYIIGAAYSIPDIALRVSLTYETAFDIDLRTKPSSAALAGAQNAGLIGKKTTTRVPAAWELAFQTGIAPGTLLFGSIRHTAWSDANIVLFNSENFNPKFAVTDFSDATTYTLGLGKQLSEQLSASVSVAWEPGDGKPSTLQPTNGKFTLGGGIKYKLTENIAFSAGASHIWLGDNKTNLQIAGRPEAKFEDNSAWAFGAKIGVNF